MVLRRSHFPRDPGMLGWMVGLLILGSVPVSAQDGIGFRFAFGWQDMAGDMADVFDGAVDAEASIFFPAGPFRLGGGANMVSLAMDELDATFSQVRFHLLVGYPLRLSGPIRPYVEARYTFRRLRPEDDRYFGGEDEVLRDFVASGSGVEGVLGAEIVVHPRLALDLSTAVSPFSVSPDLTREGLGPYDSGISWRVHAGISWYPMNGRR